MWSESWALLSTHLGSILSPALARSATVGKLFRLPLCRFPHLENGDNISACFNGMLPTLSEVMHVPHLEGCPALSGMAQWVGHRSANLQITSSIPGRGTCLGCGPGLQ